MPCLALQHPVTSTVWSTWELLSLVTGCPTKKGFRYLMALICISYSTGLQSQFCISVLRQSSVMPSDLATAMSSLGQPLLKSCPAQHLRLSGRSLVGNHHPHRAVPFQRCLGHFCNELYNSYSFESCRLHKEIQVYQLVLLSLQELMQKWKRN